MQQGLKIGKTKPHLILVFLTQYISINMANKNIRTLSSRKELDDNLFENIADLSQKNASKEDFQELSKRFLIDDHKMHSIFVLFYLENQNLNAATSCYNHFLLSQPPYATP